MAIAYIALGANLGEPADQLRAALHTLSAIPQIQVQARSSLYRSAPLGPTDQPYYCNAVCKVATSLTPEQLLEQLLAIERSAGRIRSADRWGPRLLDLDLLHVEGQQRDSAQLKLPHPGIAHRNFVLVPLAEIAPSLEIPGLGPVAALAGKTGSEGLELWPG